MSEFATAEKSFTWNGALSYGNPDPSEQNRGRLSLLFKGVRGLTENMLYEYLSTSCSENLTDSILLVFHLRDPRGGKGERSLGQSGLSWLCINYPEKMEKVVHLIPEYGRWDDLFHLFPSVLKVDEYKNNLSYSEKFIIQRLQKKVVDIVIRQLKDDLNNMFKGQPCSLCAKWTPSEGDSLDRKTKVFGELSKAMGLTSKKFRKMFNSPLRAYLNIVEKYMCTATWPHIDFNKVPACAMKRLKYAFEKHDPDRFKEWSRNLSTGKNKVNSSVLYPYELVKEVIQKNKADEVCEVQWKNIVDEVRNLGVLGDSIAVVDTSNSMTSNNSLPFYVAISMGLLISEIVQGQFHGHLITFNMNPEFKVIPDGTFFERVNQVSRMGWGCSTNLQKTFEMILKNGVEFKIPSENMPKRVFIISDMQFNKATEKNTNMEQINEMYKNAGYIRPHIVFWNVNGQTKDFPCTTNDDGTAMISGFSPSIFKAVITSKDLSSVSRYEKIRCVLEPALTHLAIPTETKPEVDNIELLDVDMEKPYQHPEDNLNKSKVYSCVVA
jgi:Domain of unknown function (DUF2828)